MSLSPLYPTTITILFRFNLSRLFSVRSAIVTPLTLTIHFVESFVSAFKRFPIPAAKIIACILSSCLSKNIVICQYPIYYSFFSHSWQPGAKTFRLSRYDTPPLPNRYSTSNQFALSNILSFTSYHSPSLVSNTLP